MKPSLHETLADGGYCVCSASHLTLTAPTFVVGETGLERLGDLRRFPQEGAEFGKPA